MYFTRRRRGRPRQDHTEVDKGTEELQQKRKVLLEKGQEQESFLAESLLGILYAHKLISKPLYEAGRFFGELGYRYEPCLGHTFRQRTSVLILTKGGSLGKETLLSDRQDEKLTQAWRKALKALKQAGHRPYKIVLAVVFYDQDLYTNGFLHSILGEIEPLRKGLGFLEVYFKGGLKGRRDMPYDLALKLGRSTTTQQPSKELQPHIPPRHPEKAYLLQKGERGAQTKMQNTDKHP